MSVTTYSTQQLMGFYDRNPDKFQPFLTNLFCPQTITFDSEEVALDVITSDKKLAPFVAASVAGKAREQRGFTTEFLKPPYIKEKDAITPEKYFKRMAGEAFTGSMSPAQRLLVDRGNMIMEHDKRIARRIEWMVSRMIQDGVVTVVGDAHPEATVDYNQDAANNVTLTGAANWSTLYGATPNSDQPLEDLESWAALTNVNANVLIMEKSVYAIFRKFGAVKDLMDRDYRGDEANSIIRSPSNNQEVEYKGTLGSFDIWVYNGHYENDAGNRVNFIDTGRIIMTNYDLGGAILYGAIKDVQNLTATSRFFKSWVEQDPSSEMLLTQSAPVPTLPNINDIVSVNTLG